MQIDGSHSQAGHSLSAAVAVDASHPADAHRSSPSSPTSLDATAPSPTASTSLPFRSHSEDNQSVTSGNRGPEVGFDY
jgi:hypothetical protein